MSARIVHTFGYVLHTRAVHESDRIITLLTEQYGVLEVLARGVRKQGAKLQAYAYPYRSALFVLVLGKRCILKDVLATQVLEAVWRHEARYRVYVQLLRSIFLVSYAQQTPCVEQATDEPVVPIVRDTIRLLCAAPQGSEAMVRLAGEVMALVRLGLIDGSAVRAQSVSDLFAQCVAAPTYAKQCEALRATLHAERLS